MPNNNSNNNFEMSPSAFDGCYEYPDYYPLDDEIDAVQAQNLFNDSLIIIKENFNANDEAGAILELDVAIPVLLASQFYGSAWGLVTAFNQIRSQHYDGQLFLD